MNTRVRVLTVMIALLTMIFAGGAAISASSASSASFSADLTLTEPSPEAQIFLPDSEGNFSVVFSGTAAAGESVTVSTEVDSITYQFCLALADSEGVWSCVVHSMPTFYGTVRISSGADTVDVLFGAVNSTSAGLSSSILRSGQNTFVGTPGGTALFFELKEQFTAVQPESESNSLNPLGFLALPHFSSVQKGDSGWDTPTPFSTALRTAQNLPLDNPLFWAILAVTPFLLIALLALPAELFESTLRENYNKFFPRSAQRKKRIVRVKSRLLAFTGSWAGRTIFVIAAAVITAGADPTLGFDLKSLRLVLGMVIVLVVINYVGIIASHFYTRHRYGINLSLSMKPLAIVLTIVSVLFSRTLGIQPGFLFGLIMGVELGRFVRRSVQAKVAVLVSLITLALGVTSWFSYSALSSEVQAHPAFGILLASEVLTGITVECLTVLLVILLPLTFLEGHTVFRWSKIRWFALYATAVFLFALILLPVPPTWSQFSEGMTLWLVASLAFTLVSILFWLYCRVRFGSEKEEEQEEEQPQEVLVSK